MAIIAPDQMLDERSSYEYLRGIAHVDPTAARFASEKCSASSIGCTPTRLPNGAARNRRCHARNLGHDGHLGESLRGYRTSEQRAAPATCHRLRISQLSWTVVPRAVRW